MARTYEEIAEYVENQSQGKCKVLSAKPEHTFEDLGFRVNVWNVKTATPAAGIFSSMKISVPGQSMAVQMPSAAQAITDNAAYGESAVPT